MADEEVKDLETVKVSTLNKQQSVVDLEQLGTNGLNCLHVACGCGNIELVKFLLQLKRVNPNSKGKDGWTAIEIAATAGIIEIVVLLLGDKRI